MFQRCAWQSAQERQYRCTVHDEWRCYHHQHQMLRHMGLQQHMSQRLKGRCQGEAEHAQTSLETHQAPDRKTLRHLAV